MKISLVVPCLLALLLGVVAVSVHARTPEEPQTAASSTPPQTHNGLEMAVASLERASSASLKDCPPGENTVKGMTRPGEEFAIVTVNFKVLPAFKPGMIKKPVLQAQDGQTYNTAVSFVDVGKVPEFSCAFPFRVKQGTKVKTLQIESVTFDLSKLEN